MPGMDRNGQRWRLNPGFRSVSFLAEKPVLLPTPPSQIMQHVFKATHSNICISVSSEDVCAT